MRLTLARKVSWSRNPGFSAARGDLDGVDDQFLGELAGVAHPARTPRLDFELAGTLLRDPKRQSFRGLGFKVGLDSPWRRSDHRIHTAFLGALMNTPENQSLLYRRYLVTQSFLGVARHLLIRIHHRIGGIPDDVPVDSSGLPLAADPIAQRVASLPYPQYLAFAADCCIVSTNLGYAYEHTFKLLNFIATGENTRLRKQDRHKLSLLFRELPQELKDKLSAVDAATESYDFELQEWIGTPPTKPRDEAPRYVSGLHERLLHWDQKGLLHGSHYIYVDAKPDRKRPFHLLVPLRAFYVIQRIFDDVLTPAVGITRVS